jgi:hypothetical protein
MAPSSSFLKGMSQTEIFLHKRERHSYDWMARQHERAQVFNDVAVRKTDPDYHKWRVLEHRVAVTLPPHEIALHLELKVYLATFEDGSEWRQVLTQKREFLTDFGRLLFLTTLIIDFYIWYFRLLLSQGAIETSEDGHRVRRLRNIITSADSKEEALLKSLCGVSNGLNRRGGGGDGGGAGPLSGIRAVVKQRRKELMEAKQEFAVFFADAIALHDSIVYGGTCPRLSKTADAKKLLHKSMPMACTNFGDKNKRSQ